MGISIKLPLLEIFLTAATATAGSGVAGFVRGYSTGQNGPMDPGLDNLLLFGPVGLSASLGALAGYNCEVSFKTKITNAGAAAMYSTGASTLCMAAGFATGYAASKIL